MGDVHEDIDLSVGWGDAFREFMLAKKSEGLKKGTLKNYDSTLNRFMEYCIANGCKKPESVNKTVLRSFLTKIQQDHSPNYVNNNLSRIRGFYFFLCSEDYIPEYADPTRRIKFLKHTKKVIGVFNDDEVIQMIEAAGSQKNKFHAERDKLMFMIMADCGLRVNELVSLENTDVFTDKLFIRHGKGDKQRLIYLTPQVGRQLLKYQRVRDAYFKNKNIPKNKMLFRNFRGEAIRNDGVQKVVKRMAARCDIRPEVRPSPHTFRHWFAQSQVKNGVSIYTLSKLLGHSSINTTQIYLQGLTDEELLESAIKTSPLLNISKNRS